MGALLHLTRHTWPGSVAVAVPANNGWEIGKSYSNQSSGWNELTTYNLKFKVTAAAK